MQAFRKFLVWFLSLCAFAAVLTGAYFTMRSPLFLVQVVEVVDQPESAPVDAQTITGLAAVPIGKVSLFELDLSLVEQRILKNPWVREVSLQKRFPQTLSIGVSYRKPVALVQIEGGALSYVDGEGAIFGKVNLSFQPDLPVFSGFVGDDRFRVLDGVHLLGVWQRSPLHPKYEVSSLAWDGERGFRVLVVYPLAVGKGRTWVDLGQEAEEGLELQLQRLSQVFSYLVKKSIASRQIWADAGKKIVVKTAKGS